jgi:hypothetical protein
MKLPSDYQYAIQLKKGEEVSISGVRYRVTYVEQRNGGGSGMGEYPPSCLVVLNNGAVYRYDPWAVPNREKLG